MVAFLNSQNVHENPVLANGPIPELLAHGPINGGTFFLTNIPKPRLGPWACLRGITVQDSHGKVTHRVKNFGLRTPLEILGVRMCT